MVFAIFKVLSLFLRKLETIDMYIYTIYILIFAAFVNKNTWVSFIHEGAILLWLGGGGLALLGSGTLHTWAKNIEELPSRLTDVRKIDKTKFMDDSAYR